METRINFANINPEAYKALYELSGYLSKTSLTAIHKELIKIRASQINGCAFCIDMHTKDARKAGETEQRIYALNAWRETPFFSKEEQAILALTEEMTLINKHVTDATYQQAADILGEKYLSEVMMAVVIINAWNRIAITTNMSPVQGS